MKRIILGIVLLFVAANAGYAAYLSISERYNGAFSDWHAGPAIPFLGSERTTLVRESLPHGDGWMLDIAIEVPARFEIPLRMGPAGYVDTTPFLGICESVAENFDAFFGQSLTDSDNVLRLNFAARSTPAFIRPVRLIIEQGKCGNMYFDSLLEKGNRVSGHDHVEESVANLVSWGIDLSDVGYSISGETRELHGDFIATPAYSRDVSEIQWGQLCVLALGSISRPLLERSGFLDLVRSGTLRIEVEKQRRVGLLFWGSSITARFKIEQGKCVEALG